MARNLTEVAIEMADISMKTVDRNGKPGGRKFFLIGPDTRGGGKGHGIILENKKALITPGLIVFAPPPGKKGFADLPETPHLIYDRKKGKMPRDLELFGSYWLVSEPLKHVFESVDSAGFAFVACDFTLPDGSKGPQYYLCDIIRVIDAINEEASKLKVIWEHDYTNNRDIKRYSILGRASLSFFEEKLAGVHVFEPLKLAGNAVCDDVLRTACTEASLKGIRFEDTTDL